MFEEVVGGQRSHGNLAHFLIARRGGISLNGGTSGQESQCGGCSGQAQASKAKAGASAATPNADYALLLKGFTQMENRHREVEGILFDQCFMKKTAAPAAQRMKAAANYAAAVQGTRRRSGAQRASRPRCGLYSHDCPAQAACGLEARRAREVAGELQDVRTSQGGR